MASLKHIVIFTDGACIGNPGPGGFGVVLVYQNHRKELSGGFRRTTNNRMEIWAAVAGLEALKETCCATLYSDSQYLVNSMQKGWTRKWKANGWRRGKDGKALNPDLWDRLLRLCEFHSVEFKWLRGHAGMAENERCDRLAIQAAERSDLPPDEGYEAHTGR